MSHLLSLFQCLSLLGVWILNDQCVITASIDQRLIVWSIRENNAELEVCWYQVINSHSVENLDGIGA